MSFQIERAYYMPTIMDAIKYTVRQATMKYQNMESKGKLVMSKRNTKKQMKIRLNL